jgi:hypothetical protein
MRRAIRGQPLRDSGFRVVLNQWLSIFFKNTASIGNPDADPMTESMSHFGQIAVRSPSIQRVTSPGGKVAKQ